MRFTLLTLVSLAVLATPAPAAMPIGGAAAAATPQTAGAKPVSLKVSLTLELRCAEPGPAAIVITCPAPGACRRHVLRKAVWINGGHPKGVNVSNHTLTLQPAARRGTCTVLAPGTIKVQFTRAAKFGNPRKSGRYTIRASIGSQDFSARVTITPAG